MRSDLEIERASQLNKRHGLSRIKKPFVIYLRSEFIKESTV